MFLFFPFVYSNLGPSSKEWVFDTFVPSTTEHSSYSVNVCWIAVGLMSFTLYLCVLYLTLSILPTVFKISKHQLSIRVYCFIDVLIIILLNTRNKKMTWTLLKESYSKDTGVFNATLRRTRVQKVLTINRHRSTKFLQDTLFTSLNSGFSLPGHLARNTTIEFPTFTYHNLTTR